MDKKASLAFLQSCIDMVESASEQDIVILQRAYDANCLLPLVSSEFEFIPPITEKDYIIDATEKMNIVFNDQELMKSQNKVQVSYKLVGNLANNEQEIMNAAFAA